jgi:hypothetical protein
MAVSPCNIGHSFLNRKKIILNGKQKKIEWKQTHTFNSTWFWHHLDPILCNNFSCRSESTEKPILAVTDPRARLGLNLELSPTHARNMHLVLSPTIGLVSPQFHVCFDDFFETCKYGVTDAGLASTWQRLAGFKRGSLNEPVLHTSDGLLGQSQILHTSV